MIEEYIDRIVFLETDGVDAVYAQREQELQRMPYEMERILLRFVAEGKPKELIDFCLRTLAQSPELRIPIGRTSKNKTRQLKYNAVSGIAIVCRAAMIGGAPEIECYARSDSAIMRIDETDNELTILKILIQTTIDYATLHPIHTRILHWSNWPMVPNIPRNTSRNCSENIWVCLSAITSRKFESRKQRNSFVRGKAAVRWPVF